MEVQVWLPLISGLAGALIGALANAYLRERSDRKASRENLVGEIALFSKDCLAALLELYQTQAAGASLEKWSKLAAIERLIGRGGALEIRIFREFRSRRVRVAFRRVFNRVESLKDEIALEEDLNPARFKIGCDWIERQTATAIELVSSAAGINVVDRSRFIFVGFRKVTLEDRLALSFDSEPLPWRYALALQFEDDLPVEGVETIHQRTNERVGKMLCPTHGHAPHIVLVGRSSNFTVEIEACCREFIEQVHRRFMGLG